jgi:aminodeoxyfutalosine synthase
MFDYGPYTSIAEKALTGQRISDVEGLSLYDAPLPVLGSLADTLKRGRHGQNVTFIKNYYLSVTNICKYKCAYCGFRRDKWDSDAYTQSLDQIAHKLQNAPEKLSEVWFSSGLNAEIPFEYYEDLLRLVKKTVPGAQIKAFTAVEIDFFAKQFKMTHEQVLDRLLAAGLDRIPGGGAEIFDEDIRKKIDIKTRTDDYLKIHKMCHERGLPTAITMLFGHVEERHHRIKHMVRLREFQDESKGVQAFIPLAYQDKNNPLAKRGMKGPSAVEVLKTLAIARIMMDNVDHIQSFWVDSGIEVTQISLHFGVDDLNGTLIEESIAHESGSKTQTYETSDSLQKLILDAGMNPVERDMRFNHLNH